LTLPGRSFKAFGLLHLPDLAEHSAKLALWSSGLASIKGGPHMSALRNAFLRVERLEDRDLPAGTVTAAFAAGTLTLTGDPQANNLEVRIDNGNVTLKGKGTTIAGGTSFAGVNDIVINLGDGNDRVTVRGRTLAGNLTIDLGNGNDHAQLKKLSVTGNVSVTGGAGNDHVKIEDHVFVGGNVTVTTNDGNDHVGIEELHVTGTTSVDTGLGNDKVEIEESQFSGAATILLGDGNDRIKLEDVSFAVASTVDGGNGTDKLKQEDVSGPVNYVNFP
jgi:acetyltransferase-like isoleucine patch superfamily enzyme